MSDSVFFFVVEALAVFFTFVGRALVITAFFMIIGEITASAKTQNILQWLKEAKNRTQQNQIAMYAELQRIDAIGGNIPAWKRGGKAKRG
jgi:predicted PurR-regulated permease PerM